MACEVYSQRRIKATRDAHVCEYCGSVIPAGSSSLYEHGIFERRAFRRYCCHACEPFIYDFWDYMDGEAYIIEADFYEFVKCFRIPHPVLTCEIECPSCGKFRVMRYEWDWYGYADCPKCGASIEGSE